jgi:hypothetical protein
VLYVRRNVACSLTGKNEKLFLTPKMAHTVSKSMAFISHFIAYLTNHFTKIEFKGVRSYLLTVMKAAFNFFKEISPLAI